MGFLAPSPPPPPPPPEEPNREDPEVRDARRKEIKRRQLAQGFGNTILTQNLGDANVQRAELKAKTGE